MKPDTVIPRPDSTPYVNVIDGTKMFSLVIPQGDINVSVKLDKKIIPALIGALNKIVDL